MSLFKAVKSGLWPKMRDQCVELCVAVRASGMGGCQLDLSLTRKNFVTLASIVQYRATIKAMDL